MKSWKELKCKLTGVCPIILHNGSLADPLNKFAREIKKISGKRKKTDADHEQMAKLEFLGSLYLDAKKRVILPPEGIKAVLVSGAKKGKEGVTAKSGVLCSEYTLLDYDGPKDPEKLWEDEQFRLRVPAKVGQSRIIRTRPIFNKWSAVAKVMYNPSICNEEQVVGWFQTAGEQCGAFDWRPEYGRFTAEAV